MTTAGSASVLRYGRVAPVDHGSGVPNRPPAERNRPTARCSQALCSSTGRTPTAVAALTVARNRTAASTWGFAVRDERRRPISAVAPASGVTAGGESIPAGGRGAAEGAFSVRNTG